MKPTSNASRSVASSLPGPIRREFTSSWQRIRSTTTGPQTRGAAPTVGAELFEDVLVVDDAAALPGLRSEATLRARRPDIDDKGSESETRGAGLLRLANFAVEDPGPVLAGEGAKGAAALAPAN